MVVVGAQGGGREIVSKIGKIPREGRQSQVSPHKVAFAQDSKNRSRGSILLSVYSVNTNRTQCKIEFKYASHCVSKKLTPRRMPKSPVLDNS